MAGVPNISNSEPIVHGSTMGSAALHVASEKSKEDTDHLGTVPTKLSVVDQEEPRR